MKLLQTLYNNNFILTIKSWKRSIPSGNAALFHIYVPYNQEGSREKLEKIRKDIKENAPEIPVVGCSATGEILNGHMMDQDVIVTLMVFEEPSTRIEVVPFYDISEEVGAKWLLDHGKSIPDIKGIEIITSASYQQLEDSGSVIDKLPKKVEIFGGVAVGDEIYPSFVFANDSKCSMCGTAVVFYSGPELHLQTNRMFGWNPIGYPLKVTKAEGPVVYELDGKPAYDVYKHYLQIKKDANFFYNALEFPWEVRFDQYTTYIRHAKSVNPDGSIVMSSNIPQGSEIRLSYGDPRRIMEHTKQTGIQICEFAPQVVNIINCMGRKLFWGGKEKVEIAEISRYLKTTGFSALGEIMRFKGMTLLNNLSIVTVAMREGPIREKIDLDLIEEMKEEGALSITTRLAIFINTITEELMEKNAQLNYMLYKASHDALTRLYNRGAIERIIYETAEPWNMKDEKWYLIMFDIDDFKQINDECGHAEGDNILRMTADSLTESVKDYENVSVGRWGGEEFMIFMHSSPPDKVDELAHNILNTIKKNSKGDRPITVSIGVTEHHADDDIMQTIQRVDELMYKAKRQGKDQVCSDLFSE